MGFPIPGRDTGGPKECRQSISPASGGGTWNKARWVARLPPHAVHANAQALSNKGGIGATRTLKRANNTLYISARRDRGLPGSNERDDDRVVMRCYQTEVGGGWMSGKEKSW